MSHIILQNSESSHQTGRICGLIRSIALHATLDRCFLLNKKYQYFSYFSVKAYVVVTH